MTVRALNTTKGNWNDPNSWTPSGVPTNGDGEWIITGEVDANTQVIDGQLVIAAALNTNPVILGLTNTALGPTTFLITNGLHNQVYIGADDAALEGAVLNINGASTFQTGVGHSITNYGWVGAGGGTSLAQTYFNCEGQFINAGNMVSGSSGDLVFNFGNYHGVVDNTPHTLINSGGLYAMNGGSAILWGQRSDTVLNMGLIKADNGFVDVVTPLANQGGQVVVTDGGTLELDDASSGGTIQIQSGMLKLGAGSALNFLPTLDLEGPATLEFESTTALTATYDQSVNALDVTATYAGSYQNTAHIQLAAGHSYQSSDFTVNGNQVIYSPHSA